MFQLQGIYEDYYILILFGNLIFDEVKNQVLESLFQNIFLLKTVRALFQTKDSLLLFSFNSNLQFPNTIILYKHAIILFIHCFPCKKFDTEVFHKFGYKNQQKQIIFMLNYNDNKLMYNYHMNLNSFVKFLRPPRCIGVEVRSILFEVNVWLTPNPFTKCRKTVRKMACISVLTPPRQILLISVKRIQFLKLMPNDISHSWKPQQVVGKPLLSMILQMVLSYTFNQMTFLRKIRSKFEATFRLSFCDGFFPMADLSCFDLDDFFEGACLCIRKVDD